MKVDIVTAFPDMFSSLLSESILKKAQENGFLEATVHDLRDYTTDKHRQIDDTPYGGGPGMLIKVEPLYRAIEELKSSGSHIILLTPQGKILKQEFTQELSKKEHLIMICGHYEGVDERIRSFVDEEISLGDYILTGGELPAMVLLDAVTRKLDGVLGSSESLAEESFEKGLLEYPQYTKPAEFEGLKVPEVLLSGHHQKIEDWRKEESLRRTKERRPDLLK
ncbi:MAG TPA: tRNA (guanosine(37)-N1)-methyltransferase TrmD [Actinobacteria bacterium]|nr:tRNA (guanosine(37)-N1)-methyltransferase TrmD [Actinomycetota bacterium]